MAVRQRPGHALEARPVHIIWIVDCSGSMAGSKIEALNQAIRNVIPEMQRMAKDNPSTQVLVRAVKFSKGAQWLISEPTPIDDFKWIDLTADSVTDKDMGEALSLVAEQLTKDNNASRALPPTLVLVTDGKPTDDFSAGLRNLMNEPRGKQAIRLALSIGEDADLDVLQKFIGNPELIPLLAQNAEELVHYIVHSDDGCVLESKSDPESQLSKPTPYGSVPTPTTSTRPVPTQPSINLPNIPIPKYPDQQKVPGDDIW